MSSHMSKPGGLKQINKGHKMKFRTKGSLEKEHQGRVASFKASVASQKDHRQERRNKANQLRKNHRLEINLSRMKSSPPFLIALVDLCHKDNSEANKLFDQLLTSCSQISNASNPSNPVTFYSSRLKKYVSLVVAPRDPLSVLELAKTADLLLFVLSASHDIDENGTTIVSCLYMQGFPTVSHVIVGLETLSAKRRADTKRDLTKYALSSFSETRVHAIEKPSDVDALLWAVLNQKSRHVHWSDQRSHMYVENSKFVQVDEGLGSLQITGYIRGRPWNVNGLVYLPGFGAYQIVSIKSAQDPFVRANPNQEGNAVIHITPNLQLQESLQMDLPIDPMAAEQTWPTEEELRDADRKERIRRSELASKKGSHELVRAPKGTSFYQAAWIEDASDANSDEDESCEAQSEQSGHEFDEEDHLDNRDDDDDASFNDGASEENLDLISRKETDDAERAKEYDDAMQIDEEEAALEKLRAAADDARFPDEVDTPQDIAARVRFQKYRGLDSFRSSPWDPKEDLPVNYSRIYQFENFSRTCKRVLSQDEDDVEGCVSPGEYVTIEVASVPVAFLQRNPLSPLVIYNLLQHENKMSVIHFQLKMHAHNTVPIKSKEKLIFSTGVRTFSAGAIFSQHALGEKHKFERYFQPGSTVIASVFAPIMFPPAPVLVFQEITPGVLNLVASGTVHSVNPDRMIIKRIRLSGYPVKINKGSAVLRYMFFNPEDILWFKPVELVTKLGRRGHIKESLGTHGHMKCIFDKPIKQHDVVLMNLYKRVYPKWTYEEKPLDTMRVETLHIQDAPPSMSIDE